VFGVMTLVGVMSMGRIREWTAKSKVERAAQMMAQDLKSAFAIAQRNGKPVLITIDSVTGADSIRFRLSNVAGDTTYRRRLYGTRGQFGLKPTELTVTARQVRVFPMGFASKPETVTVVRDGLSRTVIMSRAGIVRIR
jgi:hypothetical protein